MHNIPIAMRDIRIFKHNRFRIESIQSTKRNIILYCPPSFSFIVMLKGHALLNNALMFEN